MRRNDLTLTTALCLSLALHALVCVGAAERYVHDTRVWLPGFSVEPMTAALYFDEPAAQPTPEEIHMRLGDASGKGTAIDASPGDQTMIAPKGFQDQPFLSRDPAGPGNVGDEPTESTMLPGDGSAAPEAPAPPSPPAQPTFGLSADQGIQQPFDSAPPKESTSPPDEDGDHPIDPHARQRADDLPDAIAAPSTPPAPPSLPPNQSSGAQPGPLTAADPAPKADSEIDPTSASVATAGMDLRRGATAARAGRKHRVTRPRINLAVKADLTAIRTGNLILRIRVDADGNVRHVNVIKSSGSDSLDQACRVAAYEWWFEPIKDAGGKTIGDEFPFVIVF